MNPGSRKEGEPKARHVLLVTQLFFFSVLAICYFINHSATAEADGISFYGVYHVTIPLLVPAFLGSSYGLWRTSTYFASSDAPPLTVVGLRLLCVALIALLVTPFNKGTFLNWTHMTIGVIAALVELSICLLLLVQHRSPRSLAAFSLALVGGVLAAVSLPDWSFSYLLQGQTIFEIGVGWCLIEWTYALHGRQQRVLAVSTR